MILITTQLSSTWGEGFMTVENNFREAIRGSILAEGLVWGRTNPRPTVSTNTHTHDTFGACHPSSHYPHYKAVKRGDGH